MKHVENFNPEYFDAIDLWRQTKELAAELPGLHVSEVSSSPRVASQPVAVTLGWQGEGGSVEFSGGMDLQVSSKQHRQAVVGQLASVMGCPEYIELRGVTKDTAPGKSPYPEAQYRIAQGFLPFAKRIVVVPDIFINDGSPEAGGFSTTLVPELSSRLEVKRQAYINLHLAGLVGCELDFYHDVIARTDTWTYSTGLPKGLKWL